MDIKDKKEIIAKRIARELNDGNIVNLGIGMPTLVADYLPEGVDIVLHSENGFLGLGPKPEAGKEDKDLINAGGQPVTISSAGMFFDSAESFSIIRGEHLDVTVLGALQVDAQGNLANWMIPNKFVPGMGGAMDLVVGAKKVIVATLHTTKNGKAKLLNKCTLPLTAVGEVNLIVSEMGVFEVNDGKLMLKEINPQYTVEEVQGVTEANLIIPDDLKKMYF